MEEGFGFDWVEGRETEEMVCCWEIDGGVFCLLLNIIDGEGLNTYTSWTCLFVLEEGGDEFWWG